MTELQVAPEEFSLLLVAALFLDMLPQPLIAFMLDPLVILSEGLATMATSLQPVAAIFGPFVAPIAILAVMLCCYVLLGSLVRCFRD
jgi:hypothetical protein